MNTITIETQKLLPIVQENKERHNIIYQAAISGYWAKAVEVLQHKLSQVNERKQIENYLGLAYPVTYENDYDRVIRMLELGSEDKVILTSNEFDCYVRNQWAWRSSFLSTNTSYTSSLTGCYIYSSGSGGPSGPSGPAGFAGMRLISGLSLF